MAEYYNFETTANLPIIPNYIYFYHLNKYLLLPMYPETISDSLSASFGTQSALSRTAPVFSYSSSGPRTITIRLDMHRDLMNDLNKNVSNLKPEVVDFFGDDYIDVLINYLQAAVMPVFNNYSNGSKSVIPPMVAVRFGNDIFIKGVINGAVTVDYGKPILDNGKYAKVGVNFTVYETEPFDADSVVSEGSFRGITKSFRSGIYNDVSSSGSLGNGGYDNIGSRNSTEGNNSTKRHGLDIGERIESSGKDEATSSIPVMWV